MGTYCSDEVLLHPAQLLLLEELAGCTGAQMHQSDCLAVRLLQGRAAEHAVPTRCQLQAHHHR